MGAKISQRGVSGFNGSIGPGPQGGSGLSGSAVDRTLPAYAMLVIESTGPDTNPVQVGSMQLATDGKVSGFVIFRHSNGQETGVPLENRTANAYLLAIDNTAGVTTGVAVNNASAQAAPCRSSFATKAGADQFGVHRLGREWTQCI